MRKMPLFIRVNQIVRLSHEKIVTYMTSWFEQAEGDKENEYMISINKNQKHNENYYDNLL